jgi:hypothetical protein
MKTIISLAAAMAVCLMMSSAGAATSPKEISFQRGCAEGVPLYSSDSGKVSCGKLSESGKGFVVEMAMRTTVLPSCPSGYSYIGNLDNGSLISRGIRPDSMLQYFACAKG